MDNLPGYLFEPNVRGFVSLVLAVVLPLLAGLFMKQSWPSGVKGVVLLLISAIKTLLEAWLSAMDQHQHFNAVSAIYAAAINFGIAVAFYFGLWKGTAVQQSLINNGVSDKPAARGTHQAP